MRARWLQHGFVVFAVLAGPAAAQCPVTTPVQGGPPGVQVFPADNWWNLDISNAPVDVHSSDYITWIGPTKGLHPDLGGVWDPDNDGTYGIPYVVINADNETKQAVTFETWDESDGTNLETGEGLPFYPIPV